MGSSWGIGTSCAVYAWCSAGHAHFAERTLHTTSPTPMTQPRDADPTPPPNATTRSDRRVQEGSEESFPASDPPSYMGTRSPESGTSSRDGRAELTPGRAWAVRFVRALDHDDIGALMPMLAEDAVVRVGDGPLLVGARATATWLQQWLERHATTARQIVDVQGGAESLFIELEVTGDTADGERVSWPEAISVRLRGDVASRLTLYGAR